MRRLSVALIIGGILPSFALAQTTDVKNLLSDWQAQNLVCRGSNLYNAAACNARNKTEMILASAGWCYGESNQPANLHKWHLCDFPPKETPTTAGTLDEAEKYYNSYLDDEALSIWRPLAGKGNAKAQVGLARLYYSGRCGCLPQNYAEAAKWSRLAAKQGNSEAQGILGGLYDDGKGVPQDYEQAANLYRLAANRGDVDSMIGLGLLYLYGRGVPQDYVFAHIPRLPENPEYRLPRGWIGILWDA